LYLFLAIAVLSLMPKDTIQVRLLQRWRIRGKAGLDEINPDDGIILREGLDKLAMLTARLNAPRNSTNISSRNLDIMGSFCRSNWWQIDYPSPLSIPLHARMPLTDGIDGSWEQTGNSRRRSLFCAAFGARRCSRNCRQQLMIAAQALPYRTSLRASQFRLPVGRKRSYTLTH
jgi:hypothetical protein